MEDRMNSTMKIRLRRRSGWPLIGLLLGLAAIAACGDDNDDITAPPPTPIVTTIKDSSFAFSELHTFAMPDTVAHIAPRSGTPLDVTRAFDRQILDQVRNTFIARGYTQVTAGGEVTPDFVVLVGTSATTNYDAYVSYFWYPYYGYSASSWAWYAPGFSTSWAVVYPWYPVVGVTSYDRGSLVITLVPTLTVNPLQQTLTAKWAGAATALLNDANPSATITAVINEIFQQSPYLAPAPITASISGR
jgi:hypothetical protein